MKKSKKFLALLLAVMMIVAVVPLTSFALTDGDYEYQLSADGTATITKYNGFDKDIVIPSELGGHMVAAIGDHAFYHNETIENVTLPQNIVVIGMRTFDHCISLRNIVLPDGLQEIGYGAFDGCKSLTSVEIPNGIKSIDAGLMFNDCTSLQRVLLSESVKNVNIYVFRGCTSLTAIDVAEGNPYLKSEDGVLFRCDGEVTYLLCYPQGKVDSFYKVPDYVTVIDNGAFANARFLKSVEIGANVSCIYDRAFVDCVSLTEVTIPNTVTDIGDKAFGYISVVGTSSYKKVHGFTIYGENGSKAEKYANDNGFNFNEKIFCNHDHTYEVITKEPTCTLPGIKEIRCELCGEVLRTKAVPATGHDWDNATITKQPTCTEGGETTYKCKNCDAMTTLKNIEPLGHDYSDWTVTKLPTCTEKGEETRTCSHCGKEETREIAPTGHNWEHKVTPKTCTENGKEWDECSVCGDIINENILFTDGHKASEWIIIKEPTYTEPGQRVIICSVCGKVIKTETIPALENPAADSLKITLNGSVIDGNVAYVKLPSITSSYKNHSATLGFTIDPSISVQSVKWSYDGWSVKNPEANIESPDNAETVIRPNGKGVGARSTWVKLTVTDTDGNVYEKSVKVRFYKFDWQKK